MKITKRTQQALINAAIAGGLVFFGSFTDGLISWQGVIASLSASIIIFLTRMREHITNKKGLSQDLFVFV